MRQSAYICMNCIRIISAIKLLGRLILFILVPLIMMFTVAEASAREQALDSLVYQLEFAKNDSARFKVSIEISRIYGKSDLSRAVRYAEDAIGFAEKTGSKVLVASGMFNAAIVYFSLGIYDTAIKYYFDFIEINRELGNEREMAFALANIGAVRLQMKQFDRAEENFHDALSILNSLLERNVDGKPFPEIISFYNNLGIIKKEKGLMNEAIDYYLRGIALARQMNLTNEYVAMLYNNLGKVYTDLGKFNEAFDALSKSLEIREKNNDKAGITASYRNIGSYYLSLGNYELSRMNAYKALKYAEEIGATGLQQSIVKLLYEYYKITLNADSALKYHERMKVLDDEINAEETLKELTRLELTAQFKEREHLQMAEQKRKELRYTFAGIILILLTLIAGLLYYLARGRIKRLNLEKENADLQSINLQLEKKSLEKELELKNKELATNVIYQIKKNDLVDEIVQKLMKHGPNFKKENQELIYGVIRDLEKAQDASVWNEFEMRFQHVHNSFYEKLNEINPELTPNERRLCAFLRLNMTTKEIAAITGQSQRSIDVARTRLRKKLNLTNIEQGLVEFLSTF
jgi:tetratricopeptide (TPR) repeat protein/DNA-binding CsgD family transcriptional regulator